MKITRCNSPNDNLTIAAHKYWVVALYDKKNNPVWLGVAQTNLLLSYIEKSGDRYSEFRLIRGFPIQAHANKLKRKIDPKLNRKRNKLLSSKSAREIPLENIPAADSLKLNRRFCPECQKNLLKTPFNWFCRDCCKKMIRGRIMSGIHYVYGLYDSKDELVYVGVSGNPISRVHDHKKQKKFSYMKLVKNFHSRAEADRFEKFVIGELAPPLNVLIVPSPNSSEWNGMLCDFGAVSSQERSRPPLATAPKSRPM